METPSFSSDESLEGKTELELLEDYLSLLNIIVQNGGIGEQHSKLVV